MVLAYEEIVMLAPPAPYHTNSKKAADGLRAKEFRFADEQQCQDAFSGCGVRPRLLWQHF